MPLPSSVEWLVAAVTVFGAGLAALGMATVEALAPWGPHLIAVGLVLMAFGVIFFAVAVIQAGSAPFFWLKQKMRGRALREEAAREAEAKRKTTEQLKLTEIQSAAWRVIHAWNEIAKLRDLYQAPPPGKETRAQANAREQLKSSEERRLIEALQFYVASYRLALEQLEHPIHRSICDRLSRAGSVADLRQPIRDLYDILKPPSADLASTTVSGQALPSSPESSGSRSESR